MSVYTRSNAAQFCRLFAKGDTNTRIDGDWSGIFKLGLTPTQTAAGQVDGGGIPLTGSRTNALEVNADTGSTALSGDYYVSAIKGNLVHGTADPNSSEIGILGVLNNNTAAFGSGDKYAIRGHLDLWGITNLTGANVNVGAISAYVENEAVPVVDAGNVLCGIQVYQVTNKPTLGSGALNPGVWVRASTGGASKWQYAIYAGADSCSRLFYGVAAPTGTSHLRSFEIQVTEATTQSSGYNAAFILEVTNTGAMSPTEYSAGRSNLMLDTGTKTGIYNAWKAKVGTNAAPTLTGAIVNGLFVSIDEIGTVSYENAVWLEMYNTSNTAASNFIMMRAQGTSQQYSVFNLQGTNKPTYFLVTQLGTASGFLDVGSGATAACSGHIAVLLGSTTMYLRLYASAS